MKKTIFYATVFLSLLFSGRLSAQEIRYHDARQFTLIGKAFETGGYYHRVDTARYNTMPQPVKSLFTSAAGMAIVFRTTSPVIHARWSVRSVRAMDNMSPIGHSGLDLYIKKDGEWVFAGVGRPSTKETTSEWKLATMTPGERECLLYLPLYNELTHLEIGIQEGTAIESLPNPFRGKIVVYGSSITQGASASRPGMAYPSRMSRSMGLYFINLGLSGNGRMEPEVADMLSQIEGVDAFVLDCMANPSAEQVAARTNYIVKKIRSAHPAAPIILVQRMLDAPGAFNPGVVRNTDTKNSVVETEYRKLLDEGIKNLHMIRYDRAQVPDNEGTIDGTHPNDIGFSQMIDIIQPELERILKKVE